MPAFVLFCLPVVVTNQDEDYLVDHSIFLYLMDKEGSFLSHHGSQYDAHALAQRIATDVRSKVRPRPPLPFFRALAQLTIVSVLSGLVFFRTSRGIVHRRCGHSSRREAAISLPPSSIDLPSSCSSALNQNCIHASHHSLEPSVHCGIK